MHVCVWHIYTYTHMQTHTQFKIQSTCAFNVGVETKMVWMLLDYETAEAAQSSGWAKLDELGLGTGVQKCVITRPCWRLLKANWCFSHFVCDTSAFTPNVPNLRVLLQSVHCASNALWGPAFNQLNSGCSSQHLLNSHFTIAIADYTVRVFLEQAKCTMINSDLAVGKIPFTFQDTSERITTHGANCECH